MRCLRGGKLASVNTTSDKAAADCWVVVAIVLVVDVDDSVVVRGGERLQQGAKVRYAEDKKGKLIANVN